MYLGIGDRSPADPTPTTQPDEQVSDAAETSTDAGPGSTQTAAPSTSQTTAPSTSQTATPSTSQTAAPSTSQTTAPSTSQTAAPAPQTASTANLPMYLTHTLRDRRTRRQEQPRMLPELIDARVLSILNSMTPENAVDRFCRSLSPCLGKVPDGRQERVRAAILTFIAASQGEQEPNQVLGPIEQWRAAQHQIQMPSATNITNDQNVGTQQTQERPAPSSMLPPPAVRPRYPQRSAPVWFPPAHSYTHDYGQMSDPTSVPHSRGSSQQYGQMSDPTSVPHSRGSSQQYGQMSDPTSVPLSCASSQQYWQMSDETSVPHSRASSHQYWQMSAPTSVPHARATTQQYWQRSDPTHTYSQHSESLSSSMSVGDSSGAHFQFHSPTICHQGNKHLWSHNLFCQTVWQEVRPIVVPNHM
ncbi:proteoglycan 4-like [Ranitomeya imitator]|uniref:proteoglycan 4-like n=1 Tax=Ranitomeya imitator TaxID=111125 RepID=UPI0037E936BE